MGSFPMEITLSSRITCVGVQGYGRSGAGARSYGRRGGRARDGGAPGGDRAGGPRRKGVRLPVRAQPILWTSYRDIPSAGVECTFAWSVLPSNAREDRTRENPERTSPPGE